jgi:hypothetical protein
MAPQCKIGRVYKLYDINNPEMFYIGSTFQILCKRLTTHKSKYKSVPHTRPLFKYIDEQYDGAWMNMKIELIEKTEEPVTKEQLNAIEGKYQRQLKPPLNLKIEGRTPKEYREDHKEKIQQYRKNHQEKSQQYKKIYQKNHQEEIKQQKKQYAKNHKEEIKERREKIEKCEICGAVFTHQNKARHMKSKTHQRCV